MQRALFVAVFSIPILVLFREWSLVSQPRGMLSRLASALSYL